MLPDGAFTYGLINNDNSERYPSADAALMAARAAYKGPNADGIECRVWAQRTPEGPEPPERRCYGAGVEGVAPSALSAPTDEVLHVAAE